MVAHSEEDTEVKEGRKRRGEEVEAAEEREGRGSRGGNDLGCEVTLYPNCQSFIRSISLF